MEKISVQVWLYGPLAGYAAGKGGPGYAGFDLELPGGSRLADLLARLNLPSDQRGLTFINGNLTAMPGTQPDLDHPLAQGDRVALFHLKSMWPFQYRHGAKISPKLEQALDKGTG